MAHCPVAPPPLGAAGLPFAVGMGGRRSCAVAADEETEVGAATVTTAAVTGVAAQDMIDDSGVDGGGGGGGGGVGSEDGEASVEGGAVEGAPAC